MTIKLLIIADDLTGALDTTVKFSTAGFLTKITTDAEINFSAVKEDVLTICIPTRHLSPCRAYDAIRRIAERAISAGITAIFKKIDSALRGNVGAELRALLDGTGAKSVCLIPALPTMNRITRNGTHYIDDVPVSESVFGRDPFNPVTESYLPALLKEQGEVSVQIIPCGESLPENASGICIFDCTSCEEME